MTTTFNEGAALLIPSGPGNLLHLHVILTSPDKDGQQLIVPISTVRKNHHHDPSCILESGEHEFLKDQSFVVYRYAKLLPARHIAAMVEKKIYHAKDDVTDDVYARICLGLSDSDFAPPWVQKYFNEN